ncbi:SLC13 family permease [Corynebacterium lehmanniae]|uniref:Arsenic transporter n=1 Tax=Corynebacterium lehmanniae TaxID=2913497 RepID=A0ABT4R7D1_9CORY|nr:SLC13 family permease [Corynebacterium lehmanniae]MCZ9291456.1 arsenic transporter [Corynebacterium lehmanniae]
MPHQRFLLPAAAIAAFAGLTAASSADAVSLATRLIPVLTFAAGMSAVVNLASRAQIFEWLVSALERGTSSREFVFAGFLALATVSTVFFSLDTTAIMLTPLAVQLASRFRLPQPAVALSVVWIANLASMPLPVSNLTNLLALSGGAFSSNHDYIRAAAAPAAAAIAVAVAAAYSARLIYRGASSAPNDAPTAVARPTAALVVIAFTVAALLSPVPYWLTGSLAAVAMWFAVGSAGRRAGAASLIPWHALLLAATLSAAATLALRLETVATAVSHLDGAHPGAIAAAGAVAANGINNLPAFLALEPAASGPTGVMALLIGVNVGPVVTPWASLATLLWADQLKRAGAAVPWSHFILWGAVLAPAAVSAATAALLATG